MNRNWRKDTIPPTQGPFPAGAGMNRLFRPMLLFLLSPVPRRRGDEPRAVVRLLDGRHRSPQARG